MYSPLCRLFGSMADLCRKSLPGRVAHSVATTDTFENLKAIMLSVSMLLIPESIHEAEFVVAKNASKIDNAGALLKDDSEGHLRPCAC